MKMVLAAIMILCVGLAHAGDATKAGDRVLGKWADGLWYPARVSSVDKAGVKLQFDDGDVATVAADGIRPLDWKAGARVQCNWKNQGKYFPAKIGAIDGEVLKIDYDDGDKEEAGVSRCRSM